MRNQIKTPEFFREKLGTYEGLIEVQSMINRAFICFYQNLPKIECHSVLQDATQLHYCLLRLTRETLFDPVSTPPKQFDGSKYQIELFQGEEYMNVLVGIILDAFDRYFEWENLGNGIDTDRLKDFVSLRKATLQFICRIYLVTGDGCGRCDNISIPPVKAAAA